MSFRTTTLLKTKKFECSSIITPVGCTSIRHYTLLDVMHLCTMSTNLDEFAVFRYHLPTKPNPQNPFLPCHLRKKQLIKTVGINAIETIIALRPFLAPDGLQMVSNIHISTVYGLQHNSRVTGTAAGRPRPS